MVIKLGVGLTQTARDDFSSIRKRKAEQVEERGSSVQTVATAYNRYKSAEAVCRTNKEKCVI